MDDFKVVKRKRKSNRKKEKHPFQQDDKEFSTAICELTNDAFYDSFKDSFKRCVAEIGTRDYVNAYRGSNFEIDRSDSVDRINSDAIRVTERGQQDETETTTTLVDRKDSIGFRTAKQTAPFDNMLCFGLGQVTSCITARYQLALFRRLQTDLNVSSANCLMYDPKFEDSDKGMLMQLGYTVLDCNEEGKHFTSHRRYIFFLPHCGKALYNNLLWRNWDSESLSKMVIIGNSFEQMIDSLPPSQATMVIAYIVKIRPYTVEEPITNSFKYTDVFNDLAIHVFPFSRLSQAPNDFWLDNVEPVYDISELEIIVEKSR